MALAQLPSCVVGFPPRYRSCLHPTAFCVTALLSQRCSARLKHTANHWYSLVSVQQSRTKHQKCVSFVVYSAGTGTRLYVGPQAVAFAHRERAGLECLVARRSHLISILVASGSVLFGLPQSSLPMCIPQFPLL